MALQEKTINWSVGISAFFILLLSVLNVVAGFRNQCVNGDPDYQAADQSTCNNGTCPKELDAEGSNPVRAARDMKNINLMTAGATGLLAIATLYVLGKDKAEEKTKIAMIIILSVVLCVQSALALSAESKYNDCQNTDTTLLLPDRTWAIIGASIGGVSLIGGSVFAMMDKGSQGASNEEMLPSLTSNNFLEF